MESHDNKPRRKRAEQEEIGGQLLTSSIIGEIDRLEQIGRQNSQTAEMLKGLIDQAANTKITVDTAPLEVHRTSCFMNLKSRYNTYHSPLSY